MFIIIIIVVLAINNSRYFMMVNSSNILTSEGRITMDEKYEPKSNDVTTLKNVLGIRKGLFSIYKPRFQQQPIVVGDTVKFGNSVATGINTISQSDNKISVSYDIVDGIFAIINDSDIISYIKITYTPPSLSGTDALCRFNIYVDDKVIDATSTVYRSSTTAYVSNVPVGIYIMKLLPGKTYNMDIRITEISGTNLHLGYEGYVILEEL